MRVLDPRARPQLLLHFDLLLEEAGRLLLVHCRRRRWKGNLRLGRAGRAYHVVGLELGGVRIDSRLEVDLLVRARFDRLQLVLSKILVGALLRIKLIVWASHRRKVLLYEFVRGGRLLLLKALPVHLGRVYHLLPVMVLVLRLWLGFGFIVFRRNFGRSFLCLVY